MPRSDLPPCFLGWRRSASSSTSTSSGATGLSAARRPLRYPSRSRSLRSTDPFPCTLICFPSSSVVVCVSSSSQGFRCRVARRCHRRCRRSLLRRGGCSPPPFCLTRSLTLERCLANRCNFCLYRVSLRVDDLLARILSRRCPSSRMARETGVPSELAGGTGCHLRVLYPMTRVGL